MEDKLRAQTTETQVVTVLRETKTQIGTLQATEDWWVTFDDAKQQIRKILVAAGIKPATFLPKSMTGGRLVMKLPDGSTVLAEKRVGSPVILVKWEV